MHEDYSHDITVIGDPLRIAARVVMDGVFTALRTQKGGLPSGVTLRDLAQWRAEAWDSLVDGLAQRMEPYRSQVVAKLAGKLASLPPEMAEAWAPGERHYANIRAMQLTARGGPWTDHERSQIARYSGWGGISSLKRAAKDFPAGFPVPTAAALIHEFYTPLAVWDAVAEMLWRPGQVLVPYRTEEAPLAVLEPSAGIGRALRAVGLQGLDWTAVEASEPSARMLRAIAPGVSVHQGYFESWVAEHGHDEQFDLVLANPPYGARGESAELDPMPGYTTKQAYLYFLWRTLDLLKPGGVGVYIIPTGWLTGSSPRMQRARERVLLRHHLLGAFRLPSVPDEGGGRADVAYDQFVVDVVVLRSRGGRLPAVLDSDLYIQGGGYYTEHPDHVLGTVLTNSEDEGSPKVRRGMQVQGTFRGFPTGWVPRKLQGADQVQAEVARAAPKNRGGIARVDVALDDLPAHVEEAVQLGTRLDRYLAAVAAHDPAALSMYGEFVVDVRRWRAEHGDPAKDGVLQAAADMRSIGAQRFLAVWDRGVLSASLAKAPHIQPVYGGDLQPVPVAEWLYRRHGGLLTVAELCAWWEAQAGAELDCDGALEALRAAGWCRDGDAWDQLVPGPHYYSGYLWPKHDRAAARVDDAQAQAQAERLRDLIGFRPGSSVAKDSAPVDSWLPLDLVQDWASDAIRFPRRHTLERRDGLLSIEGASYAILDNTNKNRNDGLSRDALSFIGWANRDKKLWNPERPETIDADGKKRRTPVDEARRNQAKEWTENWRTWLLDNDQRLETLETAYSRQLRGWVERKHEGTPIDLHRWEHVRGWTLHPHQNAAVRQYDANGSLLMAFDVGVGKTYAGIACILKARQDGRVRRPVVLVPNTLAWKWFRDFQHAAPSLRVCVIGSDRVEIPAAWRDGLLFPVGTADDARERWPRSRARRAAMSLLEESVHEFPEGVPVAALVDREGSRIEKYLRDLVDAGLATHTPAAGKMKARTDSPKARAAKWTGLQSGQWDVVILTYSALSRTQIDPDFVNRYVDSTVALRRAIKLAIKQEDEAKKSTEREEAVTAARVRGWVGEMLQPQKGWAYDPGIDWHELGIDMLVVDESQNFKNLFFTERENGNAQAAKQALSLDFRAASVREHTGGGGILLLSATPAKNSAVEFYTMLYLLNPAVWEQVKVDNHEAFVQRFGRWEQCEVMDPSGLKTTTREVLVGFQNTDELQDVLKRWAVFKTAEEVGIPLPSVKLPPPVQVDVTPVQRGFLEQLYGDLADIEDKIKTAARMGLAEKDPAAFRALLLKKTGIAQRIYLTYIHPMLPGIGTDRAAIKAANPADGPKLVACADRIVRTARTSCAMTATGEEWCLGCGHIVFVDNPAVHTWMKQLLVDRGVPASRIATLNAVDMPDTEERQQVAEHFNGVGRPGDEEYEPPSIDVVIANAVAYEGMDLQRRTCAIHHLDVPWDPATLQQRNGRGVRQGNQFDQIAILYYFVNGSNESWRTQRIERKRGWMAELVAGQRRATNTTGSGSGCAAPPEDDDAMTYARPEDRERILAARAESRETAKREARLGAQKDLNRLLRGAVDDLARARRRAGGTQPADVQAATVMVEEAHEIIRHVLAQAPDDLYPADVRWREQAERLLDPALASSPVERLAFVPDRGPVLWPGDVVALPGRGRLMLGQAFADKKSKHLVAIVGGPKPSWQRLTAGFLSQEEDIVYRLFPTETEDAGVDWTGPGAAEFVEGLRTRIIELAAHPDWAVRTLRNWDSLGWHSLPIEVQTELWPTIADRMPRRLEVTSYDRATGVLVPVRGRAGLRLLTRKDKAMRDDEALFAPTLAGWQRFQAAVRVARAKDLKITDVRWAAAFWWGWRLPKSVRPGDT